MALRFLPKDIPFGYQPIGFIFDSRNIESQSLRLCGFMDIRIIRGYYVVFMNMEIGYIDEQSLSSYRLTFPFLFFTLVNIVGAVLGYMISKVRIIQKIEGSSIGSLERIALGIVILGAGIFLGNLGIATTIRNPVWTGDYYNITVYPYQADAGAFVAFGVTWLVIAIVEIVDRGFL